MFGIERYFELNQRQSDILSTQTNKFDFERDIGFFQESQVGTEKEYGTFHPKEVISRVMSKTEIARQKLQIQGGVDSPMEYPEEKPVKEYSKELSLHSMSMIDLSKKKNHGETNFNLGSVQ